MIQPSSLFGMQANGLGGITPGLSSTSATGGLGNIGNAGTAGSVNGLSGLPATQSLLNPGSSLPGATPSNDLSSGIQQILSMLMSIISALLSALQGGSQTPALDTGGDPSQIGAPSGSATGGSSGGGVSTPAGLSNDAATTPPPAAGPAPANAGQLASGMRNNTTDPAQKQRLDTTLGKVAKDPEGAKLLQAAEANGYSIEVGDPTKAGAHDNDADSINGVTIPDQKKIVINPNAPDFDKTVVHELVHAATQNDGNSQTEEGMADVIGYRVSSRMNGTQEPGSEQQIFQNKIKSYPDLQGSNDIMNSLSKLGIKA